jgi:hypothetical protein
MLGGPGQTHPFRADRAPGEDGGALRPRPQAGAGFAGAVLTR